MGGPAAGKKRIWMGGDARKVKADQPAAWRAELQYIALGEVGEERNLECKFLNSGEIQPGKFHVFCFLVSLDFAEFLGIF